MTNNYYNIIDEPSTQGTSTVPLKIYLIAGERNCGNNHAKENKGLFCNIGQVGQKQSHRTLKDRLKDPDYNRKNAAGDWIELGQWNISLKIEKMFSKVDDEIRRVLIEDNPNSVESTNRSDNTEEVIFTNDLGDGKVAVALCEKAIEKVTGSVDQSLIPFTARECQKKDHRIVVTKLKKHLRVLLSSFPGWGKSMSVPYFFDSMADKDVGNLFLFTTPITDSLDDVKENLNTIKYGDSKFCVITIDDITNNDNIYTVTDIHKYLKDGIHVVFLISVQGLRKGEDGTRFNDTDAEKINTNLREKFSFLYNIPIRLWVRDEFHKEYNGYITKKVFEGIEPKYVLDMTATPYNLIECGEYKKDQIVGDTILNVLKKKRQGIECYQKFPNIHIETWEGAPLNNTELRRLFSPSEEWDPRKLHIIENKQLKHASIIRSLNRQMYGWYYLSDSDRYIDGISKEKNPLSILEDSQLSKISKTVGLHVLAEGNNEYDANVRCQLYVDLLNEDANQKMEYITAKFVKTEAAKRKVKIVNFVIEQLEAALEHSKLGLIIVTHRMLFTGSDINILGHIVLLDKISSLNDFIQLTGRLFRMYNGKNDIKLYVACPGMDVSVKVYEAAKAEATQYGDCDPQEYYDCISITEYDDLMISKQVNFEEMVEKFNKHQKKILTGDWFSKNYCSKFPNLDILVDGLNFNYLKSTNNIDNVTNKTGAKVKKPKNTKEIEKHNKDRKLGKNWKETITVMLNESIRIGYSNDSENIKDVFNTEAANYEFGESNIILIQTLLNNTEFFHAVNYTYRHRIAEIRDLGYE